MSDNKIKSLVKQIRKMAEGAPPPPSDAFIGGGGARAPGAPGTGGTGTAQPQAVVGDVSIIAMQQALQDLSVAVTSQINLPDVFSNDPRKAEEAKARDAFGVFLAKNYMRNSKVPGVEYDPDPNITDVNKKKPGNITRLSVVMDSMYRVGHPKKGERFTDGAWGPRTNASLRNAFAFASGLLDFVNDVNRFATRKLQTSYTQQNLKELEAYAQVDPNSLTPIQKKSAAPAVTQNVKAIKNMYDQVKNQILQHAAYQQFIEDSVPFKSYKSSVTQQQIDLVKQSFPNGFSVDLGNGPVNVPVDSLISLNTLKKTIPQGSKVTPQDIVHQIWKQQEKLLGEERGF
jgi:hypothetical protein